MIKPFIVILLTVLISAGCNSKSQRYNGLKDDILKQSTDTVLSDKIGYHEVHLDKNGNILPWYSDNLGESYDHILKLVWSFWKNMEIDSNGIKYYMNHQIWSPEHDKRGLGGDQLSMALSSWDLLYNYTGDESIIENMKYIADYYLAHSLSPSNAMWPWLPYPYNTVVHSGEYDGDMILGKGFLQPDKAGSFGYELIHFYKKTGYEKYLGAALKIANTLAGKVRKGDNDNSPWPFKVNAETDQEGILIDKEHWHGEMSSDIKKAFKTFKKTSYTTFWTGTLGLFDELIKMHRGDTVAYRKAFDITIDWLKTYPGKTNKWGPFFEDVPWWSDTQINGVTYAMYIMEHPELDPDWKETVNNIFKWVYKELGNDNYIKYGVICTNEQTAYRAPGNSHSSREASIELLYWEKTGDTSYIRNAVRQLNWATYMVDKDGKNRYPANSIWMTDGYGDYVRHYLRAMAAAPQLAPGNADHLLKTNSIIKKIKYESSKISFSTFDNASKEVFRLTKKPKAVKVSGITLKRSVDNSSNGWIWQSLEKGGILKINQSTGSEIEIYK